LEIAEAITQIFTAPELYELVEDGQASLLTIADCTFYYDGLERLYTDKEFRFVLYFSHESSVTVGGKELLQEIHRIWPEYQQHLWQSDYWNSGFNSAGI